ncbi:Parallel beta-helix repeat [Fusarium oxysporum f. sp. vasinfectum]|nr:Parallel beta-helix repeat [Fusarium oxysporum f. sp. vasinfectum]
MRFSLLLFGSFIASAFAGHSHSNSHPTPGGCNFTTADTAMQHKSSCSTIILNNIKVPAGKTLDLTKLKDGTTVIFKGVTSFGYAEWLGPLITISGNGLTIEGDAGHCINEKPKLLALHNVHDSIVQNLNIKDTPVQAVSINTVTNLLVKDVHIDSSLGDKLGGHNTDGFNVGKVDGLVIDGAVVENQDDCVAINSGKNITFTNGHCSGGHGASIGSVGNKSSNIVENVLISKTMIENSENAIRIKTIAGATGSVTDVTYEDITLRDIDKYGMVFRQDYLNGGPTQQPTKGVPMTGIRIKNVTGTVKPAGKNIFILCANCKDWTFTNIDITGGQSKEKCVGVPAGAFCA